MLGNRILDLLFLSTFTTTERNKFTKVFDTLKNSFYIKVSLVFNKNSLGKQLRPSYVQELLIKLMYLEKIHGGLLWTFVYHCSGNHKNVVSFLFGLFFASLF